MAEKCECGCNFPDHFKGKGVVDAAAGASRPRWLAGLLVKLTETHFGPMLRVPVGECDVMVVCVNEGHGLIPVRLLLPHQLYAENIRDLLKKYPDCNEILCVPAKSKHYVKVWQLPAAKPKTWNETHPDFEVPQDFEK
jgi:hypothetical protein